VKIQDDKKKKELEEEIAGLNQKLEKIQSERKKIEADYEKIKEEAAARPVTRPLYFARS
jgi:prefoldin subunit 5